jgi:hypothetical protein
MLISVVLSMYYMKIVLTACSKNPLKMAKTNQYI